MSTKSYEAYIDEVVTLTKDVVELSKIRSALLSDVVAAISDMLNVHITVLEKHGRHGASTYMRLTPDAIEYFVIVPKVTPNNLNQTRFYLAHELGHIYFGHDSNTNKTTDEFQFITHSEEEKMKADLFAVIILNEMGKIKGREKIIMERPQDILALVPKLSKDDLVYLSKVIKKRLK